MTLLIDGHNLIGTGLIAGVSLADEEDELALVRYLRRYRARIHEKIVVVFDSGVPAGHSRELSGAGVEVIFSRAHDQEADDIIIRRARQARSPQGLTVVSADERVICAVQACGCRIVRSDEFAVRLQAPLPEAGPTGRREKPLPSPKDVAEWLDIFGDDDV